MFSPPAQAGGLFFGREGGPTFLKESGHPGRFGLRAASCEIINKNCLQPNEYVGLQLLKK
jgi:hypothetical protein